MTYLVFPGRHHLLTTFQLECLQRATTSDPAELRDVEGRPLEAPDPIDTIVWAVTSANHSNTRRNPLPANRREAGIEEFGRDVDATTLVYLIDDIGATPRFAEYVLKKIAVDSGGRLRLSPDNAVIGCSTPEVIAMYQRLGFQVLPFELNRLQDESWRADPPWRLLMQLVEAGLEGRDWRATAAWTERVSAATKRLYDKYGFGERIVELHRHPILGEDGDLTETRDYNTYVRAFDEGAPRKYALVKDLIRPGRIVDIGCCTGSLIRELTHDDRLRESDFFGIEVARQLYAECLHRKQQGAFANDHVFFYQRDITAGEIFEPHSVDTFTTFSLTHEIHSYLGAPCVDRFIALLRRQLALGGRWINVDVVGPPAPSREVRMWLNREDGRSDDFERTFGKGDRAALRDYLQGLSTFGRFLRFARDFRRDEGQRLKFEVEEIEGRAFVRLALGDACEFLSKKDYTDNWRSEMHETFCHWSFEDWRRAVESHGFRVHPASHDFVNPWLVEHRYRGRAELFEPRDGQWLPLDYPVTNMLLIAEKQMET